MQYERQQQKTLHNKLEEVHSGCGQTIGPWGFPEYVGSTRQTSHLEDYWLSVGGVSGVNAIAWAR